MACSASFGLAQVSCENGVATKSLGSSWSVVPIRMIFPVSIDGLILPDLPEYEFETEYGPVIRQYGLDFIFLVTPETSESRVKKLDQLSTGFLYAVSSSSTTGGHQQNNEHTREYIRRLKGVGLKNPVLVRSEEHTSELQSH